MGSEGSQYHVERTEGPMRATTYLNAKTRMPKVKEHGFIPRGRGDGGTCLHIVDLRQAADLIQQKTQSGSWSGPALASRTLQIHGAGTGRQEPLGARLS
jgi:hypothetical protein